VRITCLRIDRTVAAFRRWNLGCVNRREDLESFDELTPDQEAELLKAIAEIERGEGIDGAEFLRNLKRRIE
jgi:hypothetical protein